mgnify:CR=1 FL=1
MPDLVWLLINCLLHACAGLPASEPGHTEKMHMTGVQAPGSIRLQGQKEYQQQQSQWDQKRQWEGQRDGNVFHPNGTAVFRTAAQKEACLAAGLCMICYGHGHKASQCSSSAEAPEGDPPGRA